MCNYIEIFVYIKVGRVRMRVIRNEMCEKMHQSLISDTKINLSRKISYRNGSINVLRIEFCVFVCELFTLNTEVTDIVQL